MLKKKTTAPTLDARLSSAQSAQTYALSVFEDAARDLDATSEALDVIEAEALAEVERLTALAVSAATDSRKAATAAANVRGLLGYPADAAALFGDDAV